MTLRSTSLAAFQGRTDRGEDGVSVLGRAGHSLSLGANALPARTCTKGSPERQPGLVLMVFVCPLEPETPRIPDTPAGDAPAAMGSVQADADTGSNGSA